MPIDIDEAVVVLLDGRERILSRMREFRIEKIDPASGILARRAGKKEENQKQRQKSMHCRKHHTISQRRRPARIVALFGIASEKKRRASLPTRLLQVPA
jgi:hypothetical protein